MKLPPGSPGSGSQRSPISDRQNNPLNLGLRNSRERGTRKSKVDRSFILCCVSIMPRGGGGPTPPSKPYPLLLGPYHPPPRNPTRASMCSPRREAMSPRWLLAVRQPSCFFSPLGFYFALCAHRSGCGLPGCGAPIRKQRANLLASSTQGRSLLSEATHTNFGIMRRAHSPIVNLLPSSSEAATPAPKATVAWQREVTGKRARTGSTQAR
jgi:hypothetical protein